MEVISLDLMEDVVEEGVLVETEVGVDLMQVNAALVTHVDLVEASLQLGQRHRIQSQHCQVGYRGLGQPGEHGRGAAHRHTLRIPSGAPC